MTPQQRFKIAHPERDKFQRREAQLRYRNKHPDRVKAMRLRYLQSPSGYAVHLSGNRRWRGLPEATRPAPLLCECCGKPESWNGKKSLCLDHDHETGVFRGWICHSCNIGLRRLGDSLGGVLRAVDYLKRCMQ